MWLRNVFTTQMFILDGYRIHDLQGKTTNLALRSVVNMIRLICLCIGIPQIAIQRWKLDGRIGCGGMGWCVSGQTLCERASYDAANNVCLSRRRPLHRSRRHVLCPLREQLLHLRVLPHAVRRSYLQMRFLLIV